MFKSFMRLRELLLTIQDNQSDRHFTSQGRARESVSWAVKLVTGRLLFINSSKTYHEWKERGIASGALILPPLYRGSVCCDQCLPGTHPKKENVCKQYLSSQVSQFAGTCLDSPLLKRLEQVRFEKSTESRSGCLHAKNNKQTNTVNKCTSEASDSKAPLSYL